MTDRQPNLFTRDDTLLGVCEGLSQDFGINANLLRLAFAGGLFFNATYAIGTYLALGVVIALTRWLVSSKRSQAAAPAQSEMVPEVRKADLVSADNDMSIQLAA